MRIISNTSDGIATLKLSGMMRFEPSLFELRAEVRKFLDSGTRRFIIDVSEVPFLDSSGCGEIIGAYSSIAKTGGVLAFVNPNERVRALWARIRIADVLHIFNTTDEAREFVSK